MLIHLPQKYFEAAVLVPFLDHLISQIEARHQLFLQNASLLQELLPKSISNMLSFASVNEGIAWYAVDISNFLLCRQWRIQGGSRGVKEPPFSAVSLVLCIEAAVAHCVVNTSHVVNNV